MNLIYHGDITSRPALTEEYYQEVYLRPGLFVTQQTACRASGDSLDRFVATRSAG